MLRLDSCDFPSHTRAQVPRFHRRVLLGIATLAAALIFTGSLTALGAPDRKAVERGKYLVTLGGCMDCHTPGYFFGKPDLARFLGGSEVGFEIPGLGVFHGPNLTPDKETGLGTWSEQDIVAALTTGRRPDGRELAPIMPWRALASLTPTDAKAIAAYLKSLPPVRNKVPGPFGPGEKSPAFVMKVVAPDDTATR
jgi:mono/diheme cytochrome c family protein